MRRTILLPLLLLLSASSWAKDYKSVSILGDSYSTYEGFVEPSDNRIWYFAEPQTDLTDVNDVKQTWWHQFIKDNGFKLEKNNSFSGSTICNTGYNSADFTAISFLARMDNLGCPDVIFIFGATNDSWANVPVGDLKFGSWTADDLKSFCPALTYMLSHMKDRYINTEIVYIINDGLKAIVTDAIKEACDHYSIKYVQLHDIDKTDGHPNTRGMKQIAEQLSASMGL